MSRHTNRTLPLTVAELRDELAHLNPNATIHLADPYEDLVSAGPAVVGVHVGGGSRVHRR